MIHIAVFCKNSRILKTGLRKADQIAISPARSVRIGGKSHVKSTMHRLLHPEALEPYLPAQDIRIYYITSRREKKALL